MGRLRYSLDPADQPDPIYCDTCDGTGRVEDPDEADYDTDAGGSTISTGPEMDCPDCDGTGIVPEADEDPRERGDDDGVEYADPRGDS